MPINNLKIISVNCRGLGDSGKRKDVFSFLRNKNASIYCLQDTHFTKQIEKIIYMQWGYEVYSSYGTSDSRGVTVLLNNNFEFKIMNCITDNDGNYIILSILVENRFTLRYSARNTFSMRNIKERNFQFHPMEYSIH